MRIVGRDKLTEAEQKYRGSGLGKALAVWVSVVEKASWQHFPDVKTTYRNADYVPPYVVFNVKGNRFRLSAILDYRLQIVSVTAVKTHEEYSREGPQDGKLRLSQFAQ